VIIIITHTHTLPHPPPDGSGHPNALSHLDTALGELGLPNLLLGVKDVQKATAKLEKCVESDGEGPGGGGGEGEEAQDALSSSKWRFFSTKNNEDAALDQGKQWLQLKVSEGGEEGESEGDENDEDDEDEGVSQPKVCRTENADLPLSPLKKFIPYYLPCRLPCCLVVYRIPVKLLLGAVPVT
jgi:hypothetical protein